MRPYFKSISITLIFALLFTIIPFSSFAEETPVADQTDQLPNIVQSDSQEDLTLLHEIEDKRDRNTKHFLRSDGTYAAFMYNTSVHYKDKVGNWKDIDNTLQEVTDDKGNKSLENKDNSYKVKIAKEADSNKLIEVEKGKYKLSWNLEGINSSQATVADNSAAYASLSDDEKKTTLYKTSSNVTFPNVYSNVDLQYIIRPDDVKENIILKDKTDITEFTFILDVKNVIPVLQDDNTVVFYDDQDNSIEAFTMKAPFMIDAKGTVCDDFIVSIEKDENRYILNLRPDVQWINNSEREYPIKIDPQIQIYSVNDVQDAYVESTNPNTTGNYTTMYIGKGAGYEDRTYYKFTLPSLSVSDVITQAVVSIAPYNLSLSQGSYCQINAYKVSADWNESTITWNNQPNHESYIAQSQLLYTTAYYQSYDITRTIQEWYVNGSNYGVVLQNDSGNGTLFVYSSESTQSHPSLTIIYISEGGLEGYWTYHSLNVGRAGTAYVNDDSGNFILVHSDLSMTGNRMPISIQHIFNSYAKSNNINFGKGWMLNHSQRLIIGGTYPSYIDEDGTVHEFTYAPPEGGYSRYADLSGLGLIIKDYIYPSYRYEMKDKKGNIVKYYSNGYPATITDSNGNTITYGYDTDGTTLKTITDGVGRIVTLNYTSGKLSSIKDPSDRYTYYEYTNDRLTRITYPDSNYSQYTYDANGNMLTAVNYDGYKAEMTYYTGTPYRVQSIQEKNTDGTSGKSIDIEYGISSSSFTDENDRKETYQFNQYGNTSAIYDTNGYAQYYQFNRGTNINNKLSMNSKLQKTIMNYLMNHNAEASDGWSNTSWGGSSGTAAYSTENKYIGNQSIKVSKTNNLGGHKYYQEIQLIKGKTYTFSGYIKTSNISNTNNKGAYLQVRYYNSAGAEVVVASPYINGTNDWKRYEVSFTIPTDATSGSVRVDCGLTEETGTTYFDCMQIEEGTLANRYNLVENSDFIYGSTDPTYWTKSYCTPDDILTTLSDPDYPVCLINNCFKFKGANYYNGKTLTQTINISGLQNDVITIGGWLKSNFIAGLNGGYSSCFIQVGFNGGYAGNITFNRMVGDWQYSVGRIVAPSSYTSITITVYVGNEPNDIYFDGIQLYREEFSNRYNYNADGNITSASNTSAQTSQYVYNTTNDVTTYISPRNYQFSYNYDTKHNLLNSTTAEGVYNVFTYDTYGNALTSSVQSGSSYVRTTSTYTTNGNYHSTVTDPSGGVVTFNYNTTKGVLDSVTDPKNKTATYTYDSNLDRLSGVSKTVDGQQISNSYSYQNDRLSQITHNGFSYNFDYNSLGNPIEMSVGSQALVTNTYESITSLLLTSTYGNGQSIGYIYDGYDRVIGKKYNNNTRYSYKYDASGNVGYQYDTRNNISFRYLYGISDRLLSVFDSLGNTTSFGYDNENNATSMIEKVSGNTYTTSYEYDHDNRAKKTTASNGAYISLVYDTLGRLSTNTVNIGSVQFLTSLSYLAGVGSSLANRLGTMTNNGIDIKYTYDVNGNIETLKQGGRNTQYYYNELNEIIREDTKTVDFWDTRRSMSAARYDHGVATANGKIYAMGGWVSGNPCNTVEEYDPSTDTWTAKSNMPASGTFSATSLNDKIYTIKEGCNDFYEYNPSSDTWTAKATLPFIRFGASIAAANGKIYVIGGTNGSTYYDRVDEYNPTTNTWTTKATMPVSSGYHAAATIGNKIYVVGGRNNSYLPYIQIYDAAANTWSFGSYMSTARVYLSVAAANNKIYAMGGNNGSTALDIVEEYNPTTNTWATKDHLPNACMFGGAVTVDNMIYNIGGLGPVGGSNVYLKRTDVYRSADTNPDLTKTITYSYDAGGNFTSKVEYPYTTGTPSNPTKTYNYTYNSVWKDKLVTYDGKSITYDQIGNPLTYDGWTFAWEEGRQLASASKTGKSLTFKYNDSGIRTRKVYNSTTTNYHLVGDRVTYENNGTDSIYYTYDATGKLFCMSLNGTTYYYIRNGQGDITGLFDNAGTQVVSYTYDTWGKLISVTGTLASTVGVKNPYRYRGYRYDTETGLYYCQSRYYNPEWGRWINADSINVLTLDLTQLLITNLFAYCNNNPANSSDKNGYFVSFGLKYQGEIHAAVLRDIKKRYPSYFIDTYMMNGGRCDVLNPLTGEVWEVKPYSTPQKSAMDQLSKYTDSQWKGNLNLNLVAGGEITGNTFPYSNYLFDYNVTYLYEGNGIIRYSYTRQLDMQHAAEIGLAMLSIVLFVLTGNPNAVPVPVH